MLKTKGINQNPDEIGITPIEIGAAYNFCCTPPGLQNLSLTNFRLLMKSTVNDNIKTHYWRTFQVFEQLGLVCLLNDLFNVMDYGESQKEMLNRFYESVRSILNQTGVVDRQSTDILLDLLEVERKKIGFRIFEGDRLSNIEMMEKKFNQDRDVLMRLSLENYMNLTFKINPFVKTAVSCWEWVLRESEYETYDFKSNFNKAKSPNYFLFQQIWFYDKLTCNNVFEYPLNKYQYFFIDFLSENSEISLGIEAFCKSFEIKSAKDKELILQNLKIILRDMIFRKFIVLDNQDH